ncbi:hypothetical protein ACHAQJ_000714 [Trichoderma viride]
MASKVPPNRESKKPIGRGGSSSKPKESAPTSKTSSPNYSMERYLNNPQRHETWDWEQKAKRRNDKDYRL